MDNYFLLYLVSQYWYARCEWWECDEIDDRDYHNEMWGQSRAYQNVITEFTGIKASELFTLWCKFYEDNYNSQGFADAIIARAK